MKANFTLTLLPRDVNNPFRSCWQFQTLELEFLLIFAERDWITMEKMLNSTSGRAGYGREEPERARSRMANFTSGRNGYGEMRMGNETSGQNGYWSAEPVPTSNHSGRMLAMLNNTSGRTNHNASVPSVEGPAIHPGVTCDGCSAAVTGIRYKCLSCPNFDLCAQCMDLHDGAQRLPDEFRDLSMPRHPRDHYFVRIAKDVGHSPPPQLVNRASWIHHGISCAECMMPDIAGYRYFCPMCATSYCEACEQKGLPQALATSAHQLHHNLLKMVPPPISAGAPARARDHK
jgi:hypothetical protein